MTTSYNGFKAGDPSIFSPPGLDNSFVPGSSVQLAPGVHKGDIATVLFYVAAQLDARVEDGDPLPHDDWGYAYRPSKNDANLISCHASGTAFDWNATRHPNGKSGTWSAAQVAEIRAILTEVEGTVHWGGDGWGSGSTIDSMHFEIAEGTTIEKLAEVAAKINAGNVKPKPVPPPVDNWYRGFLGTRVLSNGARGDDVGNLQAIFASRYPLYAKGLMADGIFGVKTETVVREFQKRSKLAVDGVVGKKTFKALGI